MKLKTWKIQKRTRYMWLIVRSCRICVIGAPEEEGENGRWGDGEIHNNWSDTGCEFSKAEASHEAKDSRI